MLDLATSTPQTCLPIQYICFHSPCCTSTSSAAPAVLAPITDSTVSEEQFPLQRLSTSALPSTHRPQTPPPNQTFQPNPSELPPFGQQDREPTFFGLLNVDPSLQSEPVNNLPPPADPEPGVCLCVILHVLQFFVRARF